MSWNNLPLNIQPYFIFIFYNIKHHDKNDLKCVQCPITLGEALCPRLSLSWVCFLVYNHMALCEKCTPTHQWRQGRGQVQQARFLTPALLPGTYWFIEPGHGLSDWLLSSSAPYPCWTIIGFHRRFLFAAFHPLSHYVPRTVNAKFSPLVFKKLFGVLSLAQSSSLWE